VVAEDPDNPGHANLQAAAFGRIGDFDGAIALYDRVLKDAPSQPRIWMTYGHILKTVGRQQDGIAAYRRAIALMPALGEAWWSLANLKTVKFDDADITAMEGALADPRISDEDRFHLDFALGKAFEDRRQAEAAFDHYDAGNALRRTNPTRRGASSIARSLYLRRSS
jgi:tetratricopeptide (TPR) repeat protein